MNFCKYFLGVLLLCFTACTNEETPQVPQKELNLNLVQSIAKDMGIQVNVELYGRQTLNHKNTPT